MSGTRDKQAQLDVLPMLKSLQEKMRNPAIQGNPSELKRLSEEYQVLVKQVSAEITDLNKFLFSRLEQLESSDTKAEKAPPSHTILADQFDRLQYIVIRSVIDPENIDDRTNAMEFWVAVLKKSLEDGDLAAVMAIKSALDAPQVSRLTSTIEGLSKTAKEFLASEQLKMVTNLGDSTFNKKMHELYSAGWAVMPLHSIYKAMIDKVDTSSNPDEPNPLINEYLFVMEQARARLRSEPALINEASMSPFQRRMLEKPIADKEKNQQLDELSRQREPQKKEDKPKPSSLFTKSKLQNVINHDAKITINDPGVNAYLEKSSRVNAAEKSLKAYINKYAADYQGEVIDKASFDCMDQSRKRAIVLDRVFTICQKLQSDEARISYLNDIIINKKDGELDVSALTQHHKNITGQIKKVRNVDTSSMKMLKEYRDALTAIDLYNKANKQKFSARMAVPPVTRSAAQKIEYSDGSVKQQAQRIVPQMQAPKRVVPAAAQVAKPITPPTAKKVDVTPLAKPATEKVQVTTQARAEKVSSVAKPNSVRERISKWENMHHNQFFTHPEIKSPGTQNVKEQVQAIETQRRKK